MEACLRLQHGEQAAQPGVGFVFGELFRGEQSFIRLAGEFLPAFGVGPFNWSVRMARALASFSVSPSRSASSETIFCD